jgi:hypothetical protein
VTWLWVPVGKSAMRLTSLALNPRWLAWLNPSRGGMPPNVSYAPSGTQAKLDGRAGFGRPVVARPTDVRQT